ncbi:hypothetical protein [Arthrobacter bambusae]|uniref:hypothetical protein n=1 Tax=Arthrobacter bambusae TaxID=1338426 RepID=UPI003399AE0E
MTTNRSPLRACGALAAERVLGLLYGVTEAKGVLREETELILRGSTGRLLVS